MANPNQSVRTCILKVDIKCCTGCQKKASTKLQSISGVSGVEYNAEKGLMTITGDVEPMTLVHKLTRWGKKAELVSVNYKLDDLISHEEEDDTSSSDTSSNPDPKPMEREPQEKTNTKKKTGLLRKTLLLGCLTSKSKVVQPFAMPNRNWHVPSKFENGPPGGFGFPFANAPTSAWRPPHPMMPYPPMMQQQSQQPHPMMQQQPQVPMQGAAMPYNVNMFRYAPPPTQPYFMSRQAQTVNPKLHYPGQ